MPKLCRFSQAMVIIRHTKFGLNMLKHCRDIASCALCQISCALYKNGLTIQLEFHKFLLAWSEDDLHQFL